MQIFSYLFVVHIFPRLLYIIPFVCMFVLLLVADSSYQLKEATKRVVSILGSLVIGLLPYDEPLLPCNQIVMKVAYSTKIFIPFI